MTNRGTRKALLLGGTGAMGTYLADILSDDGWQVTVTTRSRRATTRNNVAYVTGNAQNEDFLRDVLESGWDVVVDFMVWQTTAFRDVCGLLLKSASQYVFVSSYRVFADSEVISERSPRLLDVSEDDEYLSTDEYALAKARQENLLRESGKDSWTIVRPAITYSCGRFQLCTLETASWLALALANHAVPLPAEMLEKQTTMSWGRDVALMISRLMGNPVAMGEDYNVCTARHQRWSQITEVYGRSVPLRIREVRLEEYERAAGSVYQCRYDRMYDRIMDNSKVLSATGLFESDLTGVEEGLSREMGRFLDAPKFPAMGRRTLGRVDRLGNNGVLTPKQYASLFGWSGTGYAKYIIGRLLG